MKFLNKVIAIGTLIAIYSPTFAQAYVDETHCMALNIYFVLYCDVRINHYIVRTHAPYK